MKENSLRTSCIHYFFCYLVRSQVFNSLGPYFIWLTHGYPYVCINNISGATITLTEDVAEAVKGADVIDTDVWVSMGEPDEVWAERIKDLTPYKVTKEVMDAAGPQAIFLHCLPSFHDLKTKIGKEMGERFGVSELEVTDEVFESSQSVVFDEAENRMHTIKAVMLATLSE